MGHEPVLHRRIVAGVPVWTDFHNEGVLNVGEVAGYAFESGMTDIPRNQIGFDENAKTFGVYPKWPCVLVDRLFQVRQYVLDRLRIVFRHGNKHQVILVFCRARNWVAKRVFHDHSFLVNLVTGVSELTRLELAAHIERMDDRTPAGLGDAVSADAIPVFARLANEDVELDCGKRLIARTRRNGFVARFFKQSFGDVIRKIKRGLEVVGHGVSIVLVNRNRASVSQPPFLIFDQSQIHAIDMPFAGVLESLVCQVGRLVAQGHVYIDLFVHGGIVGCLKRQFHSYFPVVVFVHGCTLSPSTH